VEPSDVPPETGELTEVELTTSLIVAANQSQTPLSTAEIDRILGVDPHRRPAD
jgi:hypothetical protein